MQTQGSRYFDPFVDQFRILSGSYTICKNLCAKNALFLLNIIFVRINVEKITILSSFATISGM